MEGVTSQVKQGNLNETSAMESKRFVVRSVIPHDVREGLEVHVMTLWTALNQRGEESDQVAHVVPRVPLVQQTDASVPRVAQRSASIEFRAGRFHLLHARAWSSCVYGSRFHHLRDVSVLGPETERSSTATEGNQ